MMGLSVTVIVAFANVIISLLRNTIPNRIRIIVQLVVVAALVTIVSEVLKAFAYDVSVQLSVYVGTAMLSCVNTWMTWSRLSAARASAEHPDPEKNQERRGERQHRAMRRQTVGNRTHRVFTHAEVQVATLQAPATAIAALLVGAMGGHGVEVSTCHPMRCGWTGPDRRILRSAWTGGAQWR